MEMVLKWVRDRLRSDVCFPDGRQNKHSAKIAVLASRFSVIACVGSSVLALVPIRRNHRAVTNQTNHPTASLQ